MENPTFSAENTKSGSDGADQEEVSNFGNIMQMFSNTKENFKSRMPPKPALPLKTSYNQLKMKIKAKSPVELNPADAFSELWEDISKLVMKNLINIPEDMVRMTAGTLNFIYKLVKASTMADYMSLALDMVLSTPKEYFKYISLSEQTAYVKKTVTKFFGGNVSKIVSEGLCSTVKKFLKLGIENISLVQSSDVLIGLRDLILRLISFSLLPVAVTEVFINTLGKPKKGTILDTIEGIMKSLVTLFTFGESVTGEGGVYASLTLSKGIKGFEHTAELLCVRAIHTYINTPIPNHENVKEWFKEVEDHLILGRKLQKNMSVNSPDNLKITIAISKLVDVLIVKQKELQNKRRHVPFLATIVSDPGVGKSVIKLAFVKMCFEDADIAYSSDLVYVKNLIDEYYSGIMPYHTVCELAELGSTHRNIVKNSGDPILSVLTTMVDDAPMPLNMAKLEDKGCTWFNINYIIVDCNLSFMNADVATNHLAAIMRRIVETRPEVKPQYRLPGVHQLDRVKARQAVHPMDVYTFTIVTYIVVSNTEVDEKKLLVNGSSHEWYAIMKRLLREHREANEHGDKMSEMGLEYFHEYEASQMNPSVTVSDGANGICQSEGLESTDTETIAQLPVIERDELALALEADIQAQLAETDTQRPWETWRTYDSLVEAVFESEDIKIIVFGALRAVTLLAWFCLLTNRAWYNVCEVLFYHILYAQFGSFTADRNYVLSVLFARDDYTEQDTPQKTLFQLFIKGIVTHFVIRFIWEFSYYSLTGGLFYENNHLAQVVYTFISTALVYYYSTCQSFGSWIQNKVWNFLWEKFIRTGNTIIDIRTQQLMYYYGVFVNAIFADFYSFFIVKTCDVLGGITGNHWFGRISFYLTISNNIRREWLTGVRPFLARAPPKLLVLAGSLTIVAATMGIARRVREVSAEGLAVSRIRTPEEIEEKMQDIHEKSKCKIPKSRKKVGNSPNWSSISYMPCVNSNSLKMANTIEDVERAILRNYRHIHVTNGTLTSEGKMKFLIGKGIGIYGSYFLLNKHTLMNIMSCGYLRFEVKRDIDNACSKVLCNVAANAISEVSSDLVIVKLRGCNFADIRGYIPDSLLKISLLGLSARIGGQSTHVYNYGKLQSDNTYHGVVKVDNAISYKWNEHAKGLCGTPIITNHGSKSVLTGLHCAGLTDSETQSYAEMFSMYEINRAIDGISSTLLGVNSEGAVRLKDNCGGFETIDRHNPVLYENMEGAVLVGQMQGYCHMKPKASAVTFRRTAEEAVCDITQCESRDAEGELLYGAPPMRAVRTPEGDIAAPMNHFASAIGKVKPSLNPVILEEVVALRTAHILKELKKKGITSLEPVPLEVAINGTDDDYYINAMKPNTSGGILWPGKKSNHMTPTELPFRKEGALKPDEEVVAQVQEVLEAYEVGEKANPLIGAQLKDEARSKKKNDYGKTRVFCMSSMEMTIVQRMFLVPYYSLMIMINFSFGTGLGINMHSTDVDAIVNYLEGLEPGVPMNVLEGDYGAFDTTMLHDISCAANSVTYNVLRALGYSSYALMMVFGIFSDDILPAIILFGVLILVAMTPSGAYPTAEKNCEKNVIMIMYAWVYLCHFGKIPFKPSDFWDHIRVITYGDDLLGSVSSSVAPYFNNVIYAEFCMKHYGMKYTSATKGEVLEPFVKKENMTFLKRGFVWREDLQHWVAPLDKSSIMKSLLWSLPSKVVSSDTQFTESCVSANRELFFHYKKEEFELSRIKLINLVIRETTHDRAKLEGLFLHYDQLVLSIYGADDCESN